MEIKIALAGNPNCGKTTLFNALTGSNQFVGNWPGVTVEKKEGKLKKHDDVKIVDLPGIYSLSPYTLEEVVARNYIIDEKPNVILNLVDGSNLERNLYLTTQLIEAGLPVVVAINMIDVVRKNGDKINIGELSRQLGCKVVEISALKNEGIMEAAEAAIEAAKDGKKVPHHPFSGAVEHAIAHIEEAAVHHLPENEQRWYAVKIFERDEKALEKLNLSKDILEHVETDIVAAEKEMDDDAESIITNERYVFVGEVVKACYKKKNKNKLTKSDKIDRVLTHRIWALPIFAVIMFLVYFISVTTVGAWVTDFTNDGLFGDGFHLFWIGSSSYATADEEFGGADEVLRAYIDFANEQGYDTTSLEEAIDVESETFDAQAAKDAVAAFVNDVKSLEGYQSIVYTVTDDETLIQEEKTAYYDVTTDDAPLSLTQVNDILVGYEYATPDPSEYGVWVTGIPVLVSNGLEAVNCAEWLEGLIVDGIIGGVGAVLGFVPQIFILFIFLAFLEGCGYMARIAFVLDRIFRKFGLSGKSFIPMLIGTGCGIPGIMASRTIENERDRRMTIMTTTFIPCGAKVPFIAMIAGVIFGGAWWVAPSAYFIGIAAIILSGIILKKTKAFAGDPAPFVMELPAYHLPSVKNVLRSMWERGWSFIKKAGTVILLSTVVIWFLSRFGWADGAFGMLEEDALSGSILAKIGNAFKWIFYPLGFGTWQASVATVTGLVAKENIVATMGILYTDAAGLSLAFTKLSGYSFLIFNLLCAPCFAAIGAIKREMNNAKWTWGAIGYQCGFAYLISFIFYHVASMFAGNAVGGAWGVIAFVLALAAIGALVYLLVRPYKESEHLELKK